jgi:hypothetical protein
MACAAKMGEAGGGPALGTGANGIVSSRRKAVGPIKNAGTIQLISQISIGFSFLKIMILRSAE